MGDVRQQNCLSRLLEEVTNGCGPESTLLTISRNLTKFIRSQIMKKFRENLMSFPSSSRRNADMPMRNAYRLLLGKLERK